MKIDELILMCERRIVYLQSVRASAVSVGDIVQVANADEQISETQDTLNQLRTLSE